MLLCIQAQPSRAHAIRWSHVQVTTLCSPSCRRRSLGGHKCLRSQSQHARPGSIWIPYSRVTPNLLSQMLSIQVRAMAELQQAPALTPTQLEKLPVLADGAGAEPDEAVSVQPSQSLPVTLPECTISDRAIRQHGHYGLPHHLQHRESPVQSDHNVQGLVHHPCAAGQAHQNHLPQVPEKWHGRCAALPWAPVPLHDSRREGPCGREPEPEPDRGRTAAGSLYQRHAAQGLCSEHPDSGGSVT